MCPGAGAAAWSLGRNNLSSSPYWAPQIPTGLTGTVISDTEIDLIWTNVDTTGGGAKIYMSTDNLNFILKGTVALGVAAYAATGLTENTQYFFTVVSFKGAIISDYSNIVNIATETTILRDGNRPAFYDGSALATITKNGSNHVTKWANKLGDTASDLTTYGGTPTWSVNGIRFTKANSDFLQRVFTFNQPCYVYLVLRKLTWAQYDAMIDGGTMNKGPIYDYNTLSPNISAYAGTWSLENTYLRLGMWTIVRVLYNGAGSKLQVDKFAAITGNFGPNNMGGITVAALAAPQNYSDIEVKDILLSAVDDTANSGANENKIYQFLQQKNFPLAKVWNPGVTVINATLAQNYNAFEPTVIYEGNPQIITGVTNVFKMWYTGGFDVTYTNIHTYYAESLDGETWQQYSGNPVVSSRCRNYVIHVGATYYMFCCNADTAIDLFTSSDGINFTLDTANVITLGAVGKFDHTNVANCTVIIETGTWHMFYDGYITGECWRIGHATSADGRSWSKDSSSPLIPLRALHTLRGAPSILKVGSVFYIWCLGTNILNAGLPSDFIRYKSTDLTHWVQDTFDFCFKRTTSDEGAGSSASQIGDPYLLEVNGNTYIYYSATTDGGSASGHAHLKLSIANMTLAQLVLTQEGNKI